MKLKRQPSSSQPEETMECPEKKNVPQTKRNLCRMIKMAIFVLCLTGFGIQTTDFLANFYTYPTVLNTAIEEMEEFPVPALTFCSVYLINYKKYCRQNKHSCYGPTDEESFCRDHPLKCKGNKTNVIVDVSIHGGFNILDFAFDTSKIFPGLGKLFHGPFEYPNRFTKRLEACYSLGTGLTATGLRNISIVGPKIHCWIRISAYFQVSKKIYFLEAAEPFGTLYIHSPFQSFKRYTKSLTIKSLYEYELYIRLEAEKLLPSPYDTNCEDYAKLWKENNKTGPLSQEMCRHECMYSSNYWEGQDYYEENCHTVVDEDKIGEYTKSKCYHKCKDECLKLNYYFKSQATTSPRYGDENTYASIALFIESNKVRFAYHRPQYMDVELFSYVGGLLGCWLGISIWTSTGIFGKGYSVLMANLNVLISNFRRRKEFVKGQIPNTKCENDTKELP